MGTSAGISVGTSPNDFQIQVLGNKYSGVAEADVSLTTHIPNLKFTVHANQWPDGNSNVISNITTYDGIAVPDLVFPMTGSNMFDLQADTYKFFGADFCIYFTLNDGTTDYITDELCYVYTGSGNASLEVGIDEKSAPSKKCNISVNDNKVSVKLVDSSANMNDAVANITDMLGRILYNGSIDAIDISGYSKGMYVISVSSGKTGVYCSAKIERL